MAQTAARIDPFRAFNFRVEIDNTTVASVSEVSGLTSDGDAVDYREGKDSFNGVRKLVGLRKTGIIKLRRGIAKQQSQMWDWYTAVATGAANARRNGSIVLRDETQTDVLFFNFTNGFLNKIEGPEFKAAGNEVAIEAAEIVVETLTIKFAK
jgi:phage tail-like protein